MQKIKVIIGASYGDEGKGLAADFFGGQVTVLTNGGPQRGHTVEFSDGRRHVFKHFGSPAFRGSATYFANTYMVNPMQFMKEYEELADLDRPPAAMMDPRCRFTTPWDMLLNQMQQKRSGRFNSCGFGIWETVLRYGRGEGILIGEFLRLSPEDRKSYLLKLRDGYFAARCRECGIRREEIGEGTASLFYSEGLLQHFLEDCEAMRLLCPVVPETVLDRYEDVLFENAQGLLLDGNRKGEEEITTPSTTGVGQVLQMTERIFNGAEVEVCYVTRSYLTRHGEGPLEGEIPGEAGQLGIPADRTNRANHFQGALRYGIIKDTGVLADRIGGDFAACHGQRKNRYRPSVMVTHLNEYRGVDTGLLMDRFGTVYLSDGRTRGDVDTVRTGTGRHTDNDRQGTRRSIVSGDV